MAMGRVGPSRGGFGQVWVSGFWPELGSGQGEVLVVQLVPVLPLWTVFFSSHLYYSLKKKASPAQSSNEYWCKGQVQIELKILLQDV